MPETVEYQRQSIIFQKIEENIKNIQDEIDGKQEAIRIGLVGVFSNPWSSSHGVSKALQKRDDVKQVVELDYRQIAKTDAHALRRRMVALADKSDVMIICKGNGIDVNIIKHCAARCQIYLYWMDWWHNLKGDRNLLEYSKYCDWRSMTGYGDAKQWEQRIGLKVWHVLDGAETDWFYPMEIKPEYDITFIGSKDKERQVVLDNLQKWGFNVKFFGPGFTKFVDPDEFRLICNKSKIVLNMSRGNSEGYSSLRLWNLMACGSMVMTKQIPNMEERMNLEEEKHIVSFRSIMDLRDKATFYLNHDAQRENLANDGYTWLRHNRTWDNTAADFLQVIMKGAPHKMKA